MNHLAGRRENKPRQHSEQQEHYSAYEPNRAALGIAALMEACSERLRRYRVARPAKWLLTILTEDDRIAAQMESDDMRRWHTINSAPRDGSRIELLIPYDRSKFTEEQCTDEGYWDPEPIEYPDDPNSPKGCFRFDGDDGVFDIQPVAWRPLQQTPGA